jgi:predicted Zn-dependent peptidase
MLDADEVGGRAALEAGWLLERGRAFDLEEAVAELRAVGPAGVARVAEEVLRLERAAVAVCGPEGAGERVA